MNHEKALAVAVGVLGILLAVGSAVAVSTIRDRDAAIDALRLQRDGRNAIIVDLESRLGSMELKLDQSRASIEEGLRSLEKDLGRAASRQDRYERDKAIISAIGNAVNRFTRAKEQLAEE